MFDFEKRMAGMEAAIPKHAKAKAERVYIENFLRSKKAILMRSGEAAEMKTVSEREGYAYSHPEYIELLNGLKAAVEYEEKCRWSLEKLKFDFEHWRTTAANERYQRDRV